MPPSPHTLLPAVLGSAAVAATTATIVVDIALAHVLVSVSSPVRSTAIGSSVLETCVLAELGWLVWTSVRRRRRSSAAWRSGGRTSHHRGGKLGAVGRALDGVWFGLALLLCTLAATCSVATLVCLSNAPSSGLPATILGSRRTGFLVGGSVALGLSFAAQLVFVVVQYVLSRIPQHGESGRDDVHANEGSRYYYDNPGGPNSSSNNNGNASTPRRDRSPETVHIKSIPYSQTTSSSPPQLPPPVAVAGMLLSSSRGRGYSVESRTPPSSSAGTISSIRSSLSHVVRPITSKTRLLSTRSSSARSFATTTARRPTSLDSVSGPSQRPSSEADGFDSWDTSAVDPHNRQTVLDTTAAAASLGSPILGGGSSSGAAALAWGAQDNNNNTVHHHHHPTALLLSSGSSPVAAAPRFLETIPASPTTSRSPSPGTPLDLEPPTSHASRRRSRSYSPASLRRPRPPYASGAGSGASSPISPSSPSPQPNQQQQQLPGSGRTSPTGSTSSEAHIHPLFRSDSPTPPPLATPGTSVVAAPNAGQVIVGDRHSIRTLSRMRSGSLPAVPSPLSRHGSFDDFRAATTAAGGTAPSTAHSGNNTNNNNRMSTSPELDEGDDLIMLSGGDATPASVSATSSRVLEQQQEQQQQQDPSERKMTPPIPEWILSAGARTSLSGYNSRKLRIGRHGVELDESEASGGASGPSTPRLI